MAQPTAVVLDSDQLRRDGIRMRLSNCGVLPICFDDEWICLENIIHIKPVFAVFRPSTQAMALHFINVIKAVRSDFPIIMLSDRNETECGRYLHSRDNLFVFPESLGEAELQRIIDSLGVAENVSGHPVLVAGCMASLKRNHALPVLAVSKDPVLIQGESGVGKRMISKAIQSYSGNDATAFEVIQAGAISGSWIRDTHRGIDRGYENGINSLCCVIENIEALTEELQSQLLLLMDKPVGHGSNGQSRMSVRFITLTKADLEMLSQAGSFRKDLYHRLSVFKIVVPPLRERKEDISVLADFFATKYGFQERGTIFRLPNQIRSFFMEYSWPGNVAQLQSVIKKAFMTESAAWADNLESWCRCHQERDTHTMAHPSFDVDGYVGKLIENKPDMSLKKARQRCAVQVEVQMLRAALSRTRGNCKKAAALLNISYKSMLNKAREYRLG